MNQINLQEILAPLNGLYLRCIGRAADMLWAHFGEWSDTPNTRDGNRYMGDWALHVQCPWRITQPPEIVVASGDCFYEAGSDEPYNWETAGESRFDRYAITLNNEFETSPPLVDTVNVDGVGGFSLRFLCGYIFEVFPDLSSNSDNEQWRLFRPGRVESHFVFPEDQARGPAPMDEAELKQIVDGWIVYASLERDSPEGEPHYWAFQMVMDWSLEGEGERLWPFILMAYQRDMNDKAEGMFAAGPLEDLLAKQGPEYIDRVEELARRDPKFNDLLGGVWRNTMTDEVWQRVQAVRQNAW